MSKPNENKHPDEYTDQYCLDFCFKGKRDEAINLMQEIANRYSLMIAPWHKSDVPLPIFKDTSLYTKVDDYFKERKQLNHSS